MIILMIDALPGWTAEAAERHGVLYRPDLGDPGHHDLLTAVLRTLTPNVVISRAPLARSVISSWLNVAGWACPIAITVREGGSDQPLTFEAGLARRQLAARPVERLVPLAERAWLSARALGTASFAASPAGSSVVLVGAGIVNLVTALQLVDDGFAVRIHDAGPDPRTHHPWPRYGCSFGGENARMHSRTEADIYVGGRSGPSIFSVPVSDGGWRVRDGRPLEQAERQWLLEHVTLPSWRRAAYERDVMALNLAASRLWADLRLRHASLFHHVGLRDRLLRLYTSDPAWHADHDRHRRLGVTARELPAKVVARAYPALEDACATGFVTGGLEVPGFTLGVHDFLKAVLDTLETGGARLTWNDPVRSVEWSSGEAVGLASSRGVLTADHYVLSPGVGDHDGLLAGTRTNGRVQGVLGVWLRLPNVEPRLTRSIKLARHDHVAEDTNITVLPAGDLVLGSGYGWTGRSRTNIDAVQLGALREALEDTAQRLLPRAWKASDQGSFEGRYCVRPWTASGLGVFETLPARGGGRVVVTGGHNTGGFSQAPAVAIAVSSALRGRAGAMQAWCHPERLDWRTDSEA